MCNEKKYEKKIPILVLILLGAFIGIVLKLFIFDYLNVSGTSMEPTIHDGSSIFVSKIAYGLAIPFGIELAITWNKPKENDIVLFFFNNKAVIKRCVAVEGTPLEFSTGSVYSLLVNDKKIPLTESQYQKIKHSKVVPTGMILAIGDNYEVSVDSRDYGFVSVKNVLGKVLNK